MSSMPADQRTHLLNEIARRKLYVDIRLNSGLEFTHQVFGFSLPGYLRVDSWDIQTPELSMDSISTLSIRALPQDNHPHKLMPVDLQKEILLADLPYGFLELARFYQAEIIDVYGYLKHKRRYHGDVLLGRNISIISYLGVISGAIRESAEAFAADHVMNQLFRDPFRRVIIFLPRHISGLDSEELLWLARNPSVLPRVTFVFGAYNFVPNHLLRLQAIRMLEILSAYQTYLTTQ